MDAYLSIAKAGARRRARVSRMAGRTDLFPSDLQVHERIQPVLRLRRWRKPYTIRLWLVEAALTCLVNNENQFFLLNKSYLFLHSNYAQVYCENEREPILPPALKLQTLALPPSLKLCASLLGQRVL